MGRCGRGAARGVGSGVVGRSVVCLVGAGLFSRVSWSVYLFHCISFRCDFRCCEGGFRASHTDCLVFVLVLSCAFSVRSCSLLSRCSSRCGGEAGGPFLVPCVSSMGRCGGVAVACSPVLVGLRGGRCRLSRPVPASRLFGTRSGETRVSGVPSCLLGVGAGVNVRCPAAPTAVRLVTCPHVGRC